MKINNNYNSKNKIINNNNLKKYKNCQNNNINQQLEEKKTM